jgi:hypothetical protein
MEPQSKPKLPPLDFKEEEKYEAYSETTTLKGNKCDHSSVKVVGSKLVCPCGAGWEGAGIQKLYDLLKKKRSAILT